MPKLPQRDPETTKAKLYALLDLVILRCTERVSKPDCSAADLTVATNLLRQQRIKAASEPTKAKVLELRDKILPFM